MSDIMKEFFLEFVNTTGISEAVSPYFYLGGICTIVLGIIGCILGFRTYRMFFSIILFMGVAAGCFQLMIGPLRSIATCVAVGGVVLAFFGYRWHRLGGFFICFLIGMCAGWLFYPSVILAVVLGVLAGVFELYFPVIAVSLMTSLWGAWMLADGLKLDGALQVATILGLTFIALFWQLFINRKQKLFTKVCPDNVRYLLEQRRKQHGSNIS